MYLAKASMESEDIWLRLQIHYLKLANHDSLMHAYPSPQPSKCPHQHIWITMNTNPATIDKDFCSLGNHRR